jgi:hypothetical protein
MPAETVYICIRLTAAWEDEAGYRSRLIAGLVPHIDAWDATFRTSYREFRAAIAEITMASLRAVRGAVIAPYEEIPEGAVVMPCDDDDWTAPHAAEALVEPFASGCDCAVWKQSVVQVPVDWMHALKVRAGNLWQGFHPPRWFCSTNNYALRKRAGSHSLVMSHMLASKRFVGDPDVLHVGRRLTLQNRNLASQTSIARVRYPYLEHFNGVVRLANLHNPAGEQPSPLNARNARHLLGKFEKYRRLYDRYVPQDPDLEWATPYVHAMRDLTLSLKLR